MMSERAAAPGSDVERLRRELAATRKRLEDEVGYYRGQAEATRQRLEADQVRAQAAEVARRRKLEDELAVLQGRLHDAQLHNERLQRRYDELSDQFLRSEESSRESVEEEITRFKAAAQVAWRSAEEEVARMEQEIAETRQALDQERARNLEMEDTLATLQAIDGESEEERRKGLVNEIAVLKQALNLSEQARVQVQRRAVRLADRVGSLRARLAQGSASDKGAKAAEEKPRRKFRPDAYGADNPCEVDLSAANEILRQVGANEPDTAEGDVEPGGAFVGVSLNNELADEFLLVSSDESLDRAKLARLRKQVQQEEERESKVHMNAEQAARERRLINEAESMFTQGPRVLPAEAGSGRASAGRARLASRPGHRDSAATRRLGGLALACGVGAVVLAGVAVAIWLF